MAKQARDRSSSVMPVMIVGGIIVVALLAFSFRRMGNQRTQSAPPPQTASSAPAASETTDPAHEAEVAKVRRVKVEELRDLIAKNAVTVIDVRDAQSYLNAHIPGSLHIPMTRLDGEVPYLPKGKPIVTYCT
jgi:rhodanese-like protein